jgi:hypothetical protein
MIKRILFAFVALATLAVRASAQEHAPAAVAEAEHQGIVHCAPHAANPGPADIIMPHLVDSKHLEIPWVCGVDNWMGSITLPTWYIPGTQIDIGPTKHVVFLFIAGSLAALILIGAARAHRRHSHESGHPKGFAAGIEAVILYLRNEIYIPVLGGHGGEKYVPFCLTLFFFIAIANFLGLFPYGSTATGNIAVTATLAIITFFMVEIDDHLLAARPTGGDEVATHASDDPCRVDGEVHEAVRAHDPVVREHGRGSRRDPRPDRADLRQLVGGARLRSDGAVHHGARAAGRLHPGIHLLAARGCLHRTDSGGASLAVQERGTEARSPVPWVSGRTTGDFR